MTSTTEAVRERPILFTGESVRAILDGRKTQTRRVVTDHTSEGNFKASELRLDDAWVDGSKLKAYLDPAVAKRLGHGPDDIIERLYCRWWPRDLLWVRETWQYDDWTEDGYPFIGYQADGARICHEVYSEAWAERLTNTWAKLSDPGNYNIDNRAADRRWRSAWFMPQWASRLTLRVTDVRVERVQAIGIADIEREGIDCGPWPKSRAPAKSARERFRDLWDSINAKRGYGWDANPWVWAITFERADP